MTTTYRGVIKTNEYSKRDMLAPMYMRKEARRSERAFREHFAAFRTELAKHVPHEGACAWFEVIARDGYAVTLIKFTGTPDAFDLGTDGYCGVPAGGLWTVVFPGIVCTPVRAGLAASTSRYLARRVQGKRA